MRRKWVFQRFAINKTRVFVIGICQWFRIFFFEHRNKTTREEKQLGQNKERFEIWINNLKYLLDFKVNTFMLLLLSITNIKKLDDTVCLSFDSNILVSTSSKSNFIIIIIIILSCWLLIYISFAFFLLTIVFKHISI